MGLLDERRERNSFDGSICVDGRIKSFAFEEFHRGPTKKLLCTSKVIRGSLAVLNEVIPDVFGVFVIKPV